MTESTSKRLQMLEAMIEKGSEEPFHHYARAMELRSLERLDEALARFAEVRERFADYVPTYLMAGQVAAELGRVDEARQWMTDGLEVARAAGEDHAVGELESALETLEPA